MKEKHKRRIHQINNFLDRPIAVIVVLIMLFVYFLISNHSYQAQGRELLRRTAKTTQSTNEVVKGQSDILKAIQQLALDTKLDSNEKTNIIICMLQVPVSQRTTDLQEQCRAQVQAQESNQTTTANPGGKSATVPTVSAPSTNTSTPSSTGSSTPSTSSSTTTTTPATKPDSGGVTINLPLLPTIHIGSPF